METEWTYQTNLLTLLSAPQDARETMNRGFGTGARLTSISYSQNSGHKYLDTNIVRIIVVRRSSLGRTILHRCNDDNISITLNSSSVRYPVIFLAKVRLTAIRTVSLSLYKITAFSALRHKHCGNAAV